MGNQLKLSGVNADSDTQSMTASQIDKSLHEKFKTYGQNAKEWMRKCALLLPEIVRRKIWKKKGFGSVYEYAGKLAGMSRGQIDSALWVLNKIEDKPLLREVVENKGINAVKPIAAMATKETEAFWAEKASQMSIHTLESFVREIKNQNSICNSFHVENLTDQKTQSEAEKESDLKSIQLSSDIFVKLEKLKGKKSWEDFFEELLLQREKWLEQIEPASVNTYSRAIPAKIKHHILVRSNKICEFRNCKRNYKILHHIDRFALKKCHDPNRIVALCEEHERLVHLGLIANEDEQPKDWIIRKMPDKTDLKYIIDERVQKFRNRF